MTLDVVTPSEVLLQIAVAHPLPASESLMVTSNGAELGFEELVVPGSGRVHRFHAAEGRIDISYEARSSRFAADAAAVSPGDAIIYLRPSRFAEADRLEAVARAEFAGIDRPEELMAAISSWVGTRLSYVSGSSRPTDGAVETLLRRRGVCRDYAHLVVALTRACSVPARLSSVYAPGLDPMDFHAVAEVAVEGSWYVVDATLLAPRSSLVRIASGRDAADTAFLSSYSGVVDLVDLDVTATVEGDLPPDDVREMVTLS